MALDFNKVFEKEAIQEKGVWRTLYIDGKAVGEVLLSAVGSPSFINAMEAEQKHYKNRMGISPRKDLTTVQNLEVLAETMAKHSIHDWRGIEGAEDFPVLDGKVLPCNLDNKRKLLSSNTFRNAISGLAAELSDMTLEDMEEDQKN